MICICKPSHIYNMTLRTEYLKNDAENPNDKFVQDVKFFYLKKNINQGKNEEILFVLCEKMEPPYLKKERNSDSSLSNKSISFRFT